LAIITLSTLMTLIAVQLIAPQTLAFRLPDWPPRVGNWAGSSLMWAVPLGFIPFAMQDETKLGAWARTRKLKRPVWIALFTILWLTFVIFQGALAALYELTLDPIIYDLMSWVVPVIGAVWGYLLGISLAWRFLDART
jgi:hypothetical protein